MHVHIPVHRGAREAIWPSARRAGGLSRVVTQVERRVLALAARLEFLGAFLGTRVDGQLERELARLSGSGTKASSDAMRDAYERAAEERAVQLENLRKLRAEHDFLLATLDHMLGTLEGLPIRSARNRLMEIDGCSGAPAELLTDLDGLGEAIDLLETALASRPGTESESPTSGQVAFRPTS